MTGVGMVLQGRRRRGWEPGQKAERDASIRLEVTAGRNGMTGALGHDSSRCGTTTMGHSTMVTNGNAGDCLTCVATAHSSGAAWPPPFGSTLARRLDRSLPVHGTLEAYIGRTSAGSATHEGRTSRERSERSDRLAPERDESRTLYWLVEAASATASSPRPIRSRCEREIVPSASQPRTS